MAKSKRATAPPRYPEKKYGPFHGGVGLAIWLNEVETEDGIRYFRSCTLQPRRYRDKKTGEYIFFDCSAQTPSGRVSLCYDDEALDARKEHKPKDSAVGMATAMGVELLTEEEYFELQKLGEFDTKRSSWIKTPAAIRKLGGALYCDRRYGRVFVGHNGADSYYSGRAFRGALRV